MHVAVLEQQIAEVRERGSAAFVRVEGIAERRERFGAPPEGDERDAALVCDPRARRGTVREGRVEVRQRRGGIAEREVAHAALVGGARRRPRFETTAPAGAAAEHGEESIEGEHRVVPGLHIDVVTLFPEMFAPAIGLSIVGRAHERGLVTIRLHHLLDALDSSERADDRPFGGGPGMVLRIEPLARTLDTIVAAAPPGERRAIAITSAAGAPLRHATAERFAALDRLVIVCGHYEGIDERLAALYGAEEISLGDFVLTGGEIPALAILDATIRLVAGAISDDSLTSESFAHGALDAPAYTRPAIFRGLDVPEVLLSGDHAKIAAWRREQSRERTRARRPDLPGET